MRKTRKISPEQRVAVDLTLLQFYFCGADLIDVYYLKKSQISNNRVFFNREKLGVKGYEIEVALLPEAKKIIDKYISDSGEYVFPWRKDETAYNTIYN